jgi:hypothetical protein
MRFIEASTNAIPVYITSIIERWMQLGRAAVRDPSDFFATPPQKSRRRCAGAASPYPEPFAASAAILRMSGAIAPGSSSCG